MVETILTVLSNLCSGLLGVVIGLIHSNRKEQNDRRISTTDKKKRLKSELQSNINLLEVFQSKLKDYRVSFISTDNYNHYYFFPTSAIYVAFARTLLSTGELYDFLSEKSIEQLNFYSAEMASAESALNNAIRESTNYIQGVHYQVATSISGGMKTEQINDSKIRFSQIVDFWDMTFEKHRLNLQQMLKEIQ